MSIEELANELSEDQYSLGSLHQEAEYAEIEFDNPYAFISSLTNQANFAKWDEIKKNKKMHPEKKEIMRGV